MKDINGFRLYNAYYFSMKHGKSAKIFLKDSLKRYTLLRQKIKGDRSLLNYFLKIRESIAICYCILYNSTWYNEPIAKHERVI